MGQLKCVTIAHRHFFATTITSFAGVRQRLCFIFVARASSWSQTFTHSHSAYGTRYANAAYDAQQEPLTTKHTHITHTHVVYPRASYPHIRRQLISDICHFSYFTVVDFWFCNEQSFAICTRQDKAFTRGLIFFLSPFVVFIVSIHTNTHTRTAHRVSLSLLLCLVYISS